VTAVDEVQTSIGLTFDLARKPEGLRMSVQDQTHTHEQTAPSVGTADTDTHGVELTGVAAGKVKSLLEQEGRDDLRLRVGVQPGGCSGLIYQLYFDERTLDGDLVRDFDGVEVVVDRMSAPYLLGATIDFADTIEKQGFTIDNPNAGSSCACGDSFS
jgi:iron-sulfur cluster assembly accessory protein